MTTPPLFGDTTPDTGMYRAAVISTCGRYRYSLIRRWSDDPGPVVTWIMLNPSTADAEVDDPTIRRCINYAKSWGAPALRVLNLYAYRSTNPRGLWAADDPVGPENDDTLTRCAQRAQDRGWPLIAAWGTNARPDRVAAVLALPGMTALQALHVTRAGHPGHPLYLPGNATLTPWPPPNTGHCDWCGTTQGLTRAGLIGPHDYEGRRCNGAGGRPIRSSTYTPLGTTAHLPDTTPGETA